jgi:hypothetical protein
VQPGPSDRRGRPRLKKGRTPWIGPPWTSGRVHSRGPRVCVTAASAPRQR